jgi:hypothetical protein
VEITQVPDLVNEEATRICLLFCHQENSLKNLQNFELLYNYVKNRHRLPHNWADIAIRA